MAKLKYDRPINVNAGKSQFVTIPKDEVWKVTVTSNIDGAEPFTNLYGGVLIRFTRHHKAHIRHRLQAHRRVIGSMEVILHG